MARDFENLHDIENLDDGELKALILQQINEYPGLDLDLVKITVENRGVILDGRVGTEQELQQIEHVVTDVLGIQEVRNDLVVDELMRASTSEAADEAAAEAAADQPVLGKRPELTEDSASHLIENIPAELYGTQDVQQAIEEGYSYEPPDQPVQEGTRSRENH
jgi:hypothetical protein